MLLDVTESTQLRSAVIYCRISEDRTGAGLGVERQRADCEQLAKRLGWDVAAVLVDNDVSAFSGKARPRYEKLLAGLEDGTYDAVLAWHTDRLHRSPVELERFIEVVERRHVAIRTVQGGELDLSTATGRMIARMLGSAARFESEHKADRIRRKALELAESGAPLTGGSRPFGYEADHVTVRESEAVVIRDLMRRAIAGEPFGSLVRWLNSEGITTTTGGLWRTTTLQRVLCSPRIAGWRSHAPGMDANTRRLHAPFTSVGRWPGIVDRAQVEQLRAILTDPSRRSTVGPPRRYLLSGILTCGAVDAAGDVCGAPMLGSPSGGRQADGRFARRYVCVPRPVGKGCGHMFIRAAEVEEEVVAQVREALSDPALAARLSNQKKPDLEKVTEQLESDEFALIQLGVDMDDGVITRAEWSHRRARIQDRITDARKQLADVQSFPALDGFLGGNAVFDEAWKQASEDRRRAVVAAVLNEVRVTKAVRGRNTFDPSRLHPDWRA